MNQDHLNAARQQVEPATPMARDFNMLGDALARLEGNIASLRQRLSPVVRPMPEPPPRTDTNSVGRESPQLVKAERSQAGMTLEKFTERVESIIERVQFMQEAVEV